jgi:hypothetical protein
MMGLVDEVKLAQIQDIVPIPMKQWTMKYVTAYAESITNDSFKGQMLLVDGDITLWITVNSTLL